jgi:hypothetical protein
MRELEQPWHQERETKEVALVERMKMIDGHVGQCSVLFEEFAPHVFAWQSAFAEAEIEFDGWKIHRRLLRLI